MIVPILNAISSPFLGTAPDLGAIAGVKSGNVPGLGAIFGRKSKKLGDFRSANSLRIR